MFNDQEDRAFLLGRRMAETAFTMDDNPFTNLQPRLARKWLDGYVSENAFHNKTGWLGQVCHHANGETNHLGHPEKAAPESNPVESEPARV